jgi:methylthioribose-1-phosphate isomerase
VALAMRADATDAALAAACATLAATRPTAINLRWALDRMRGALAPVAVGARAAAALVAAAQICDEDVAQCEAIGRHGLALIRAAAARRPGQPVRVLTHCNAGWLATVDWGTALAPIFAPRGRRAGRGLGRRDPAAQPGDADRLGAGAGTACPTR